MNKKVCCIFVVIFKLALAIEAADNHHPVVLACPGSNGEESAEIHRLSKKVSDLERRLDQQRKVQHFHLASNEITWSGGKRYCENFGLFLCSRSQIFPFGNKVPFIIGVLPGDHWAPIRDTFNDWVQVGDSRGWTALTHIQQHARNPPTWGEVITNGSYKGHLFCCVSE